MLREETIFLPSVKKPILRILGANLDFNNYNPAATDALGKTTRTIRFNLDTATSSACLYLITSNHGANQGGEEYIRRDHFVYLDGVQIHKYKTGYVSCEPYRKYNTQSSGIYGQTVKSDAQWQSFNNWCPGAYISIREIYLGNLQVSTYLQGYTTNQIFTDIQQAGNNDIFSMYSNPVVDELTLDLKEEVQHIEIINMLDEIVYNKTSENGSTSLQINTCVRVCIPG